MSFPAYPANKESGVEWMGEVPRHWNITPLKFSASCNDAVLPDSTDEDYEIKYVEISDVNEISGITGSTSYKFSDAPSRARRMLQDGDVLISTVRTYLRAIAPVVTPPENLIASTGFAVIRPRKSILDGTFLGYLLRAEWWISEVIARSVGVSYPAINASDLIGLNVPVPAWDEQIQIARFLDHETARIDALIEEQQRLIELLKEKRRALISQAVTKGLDPTVLMKNSGVEWLGLVPSHWDVKQLKHVVDPNTSITYGIVQAGPEFEGGVPYIRTSDMSGEELPVSGYPLTSPEIDESYARSRVRPGDIVMSIRASVGKCLLVPDELTVANLTQGTAKISAGQGITRNFLLAFLNASATQNYFDLMAKGATFKEITLDALRRTPVLLPPANEQIKIDQFVARNAGLLSETCKQAIQSVSLLQERRSALISAAVTGKIDVRGWQPPSGAPSPELAKEAV